MPTLASCCALRGALGPFQSTGMDGAMNFVLTPNKQGTQVQLVYNIGGYVWGDFQALPKSADGVLLGLQLHFRLEATDRNRIGGYAAIP